MKRDGTSKAPAYYLEILGDTVSPSHTIFSIVISIVLGLGGFLAGQTIFPAIAEERMVASYSLLLGIAGCAIALIVNAVLFRPKRTLIESQFGRKNSEDILADLQVDLKEEHEAIANDPVTKKEMEGLKILNIFIPNEKGNN